MTTLMTASIIAFGVFGFRLLPVSALPQGRFPDHRRDRDPAGRQRRYHGGVGRRRRSSASSRRLPASPRCRRPRRRARRAITIQFDLNRNIDAAALDVQTALTIAQRRLPIEMTIPPSFRKVNPSDFAGPVHLAEFGDAAAVGGQRIWRHHHRAGAVANSGRRPGRDLRHPEIRDPGPGRSGSRGGARDVARGHPDRGVARQFVHAGRHPERSEAGRRAAGVRPDGQGGRLQAGRGRLAQRLAGQARRGRARIYDSVENDKIATWFNGERAIVLAI